MSGRQEMMRNIVRALRLPAPRRKSHGEKFVASLTVTSNPVRRWMPESFETLDQQIVQFKSNAQSLKAEFILCNNIEDQQKKLRDLSAECGWTSIATHAGRLTDQATANLNLPILSIQQGYEVAALEAVDAAITECDALIAQTGSVLITSRSAGGRSLSALSPHHVVVAERQQMVSDLTAAFELLHDRYEDQYPSLISLITGPSRTGDIERILVLGAHGPKRLTILCV